MNNINSTDSAYRKDIREDRDVAQIPIACLMPASEQATRKEEVGDLLNRANQVKELEDGYSFSYPATEEWANRLVACIAVERECCPFFTFEMVFEPNRGPLWLRLRGPGEVKEFIGAALLPSSTGTDTDAGVYKIPKE